MAEDTSLLQEIDEAIRADKVEQFWARYSGLLMGCCILAVLATAAGALWKNHQKDLHERQTGFLVQGSTLAGEGKYGEAIGMFEKARDEGGALATLAELSRAQALLEMKHEDKALAAYNGIAASHNGLSDFARLQADIIAHNQAIAAGKPLAPASAPKDGTYVQMHAELAAVRTLLSGNSKGAGVMLDAIVKDETAPMSERRRAGEMLATIKDAPK